MILKMMEMPTNIPQFVCNIWHDIDNQCKQCDKNAPNIVWKIKQ